MHASRTFSRHARILIRARSLATATPNIPRASPDQIFVSGRATKAGSSIASEDDWQAAILAANKAREIEEDEGDSGPGDATLFASNRVGQIPLPTNLTRSVNDVLRGAHGPHIRTTALRFYESLDLEKPSKIPMPLSKDFTSIEADAYLAGLMPQLYASVHIVLLELRKRLGKDWEPKTVLDCGVGPGTAALAFHEVFFETNPHRQSVRPQLTVIEPNYELRSRTETIWKKYCKKPVEDDDENRDHASVQDPPIYQIFHKMGATGQKYDLILAPYSLSDFHGRPSDRDALARDIWSRLNPGGILLLLERGNPLGFEKIAQARYLLLNKSQPASQSSSGKDDTESTVSGHVIAPCPGDGQCPMYAQGHQPNRKQWCHFSQRLQRPDYLQLTRHSKFNIEDVNYSYVLLRKGVPRPTQTQADDSFQNEHLSRMEDTAGQSETSDSWKNGIVSASYSWPRIVLPPLKRHKHVLMDVCSLPPHPSSTSSTITDDHATRLPNSPVLQRHLIPKSQGVKEYKFARKSHWGDLMPFLGKTVLAKSGGVNVNQISAGRGTRSKNNKKRKEVQE